MKWLWHTGTGILLRVMIVVFIIRNVREGDAAGACLWGFLAGLHFALDFDKVLDKFLRRKINA